MLGGKSCVGEEIESQNHRMKGRSFRLGGNSSTVGKLQKMTTERRLEEWMRGRRMGHTLLHTPQETTGHAQKDTLLARGGLVVH